MLRLKSNTFLCCAQRHICSVWLRRFCTLTFLIFPSCSFAAEDFRTLYSEDIMELPLYTPDDMKLNAAKLQPSRVIQHPWSDRYTRIFVPPVQIITSLERSTETRFTAEGPVFQNHGMRILWRANTHNMEDGAWVDADSLALKKSVFGSSRITYYHADRIVNTQILRDQPASTEIIEVEDGTFYQNIVLPYLFAAMDVPAGTSFRLNGFATSTNQIYPIRVDVVGATTFADHTGREREVWQFESNDPSTHITWYIDRQNAPYYMGAVWRRFDTSGKMTSETHEGAASWHIFDQDVFGNRIRPLNTSP